MAGAFEFQNSDDLNSNAVQGPIHNVMMVVGQPSYSNYLDERHPDASDTTLEEWPLLFFSRAESDPDLGVNLGYTQGRVDDYSFREFCWLGGLSEEYDDLLEEVLRLSGMTDQEAVEALQESHPEIIKRTHTTFSKDLCMMLADLIGYADGEIEDGNLVPGQICFWRDVIQDDD